MNDKDKRQDNGVRDLRDIAVTVAAILLIASMIHYDKDDGLSLGLPIVADNLCKCDIATK